MFAFTIHLYNINCIHHWAKKRCKKIAPEQAGAISGAGDGVSIGCRCHTFSIFTLKALDSGILVLASPIYGVRMLPLSPLLRPM